MNVSFSSVAAALAEEMESCGRYDEMGAALYELKYAVSRDYELENELDGRRDVMTLLESVCIPTAEDNQSRRDFMSKKSKIVKGRAWTECDEALLSDLPEEHQAVVLAWIKVKLTPRKSPLFEIDSKAINSRALARLLKKQTGVRVTNNQFKDAMLESGYLPADEREEYWCFGISKKSSAFEKPPKVYALSDNITFGEVLSDARLSLSQIGVLAVVTELFSEGKFKAEDVAAYTYEDADVAAAYLKGLNDCGYIEVVS